LVLPDSGKADALQAAGQQARIPSTGALVILYQPAAAFTTR
jgi:hypothetical protein